jgi:hypothetical protein
MILPNKVYLGIMATSKGKREENEKFSTELGTAADTVDGLSKVMIKERIQTNFKTENGWIKLKKLLKNMLKIYSKLNSFITCPGHQMWKN